ncbi:MAG: energy coupling factor transporter S component ThiW [Acidaminococcales bacterium]|nr:energy coupling factor transporter S component ThiW [Acidaminococcales bacterium]
MEKKTLSRARLRRMVLLSMLAAIGVVLSPILRVPGMAPMQHFINVICAVLLGPWYALACALLIAIIRMSLLGINLLALTGAVFGAPLAGVFYRATGYLPAAAAGEIIGTGIIGAMVSYPVMAFVYGNAEVALFTYIPSFIAGTVIGGVLGTVFLQALKRQGTLRRLIDRLWEGKA